LNMSLAHSNKNPFYQGFLTGIATINLREFFYDGFTLTPLHHTIKAFNKY